MLEIIDLFAPALILIILLVYIHTIFGIEIIKRGVIFTDLAIGQMSAVGLAISIGFWGGEYKTTLTLLFALMGAGIITYATQKLKDIEAFIGMLYALGASAIMLLLANSADGMELFSKLSATDILFTSQESVYYASGLYAIISIIMFKFYHKLEGIKKEALFFVLLALVVTSSVQSAGVLVVFALLVAPALIALSQKRFKALYMAWTIGIILAFIAVVLSYSFDLPTGYSIVFVMSLGSMSVVLKKRDN